MGDRWRGALRPADVAGLAAVPPRVAYRNAVCLADFDVAELAALKILPRR